MEELYEFDEESLNEEELEEKRKRKKKKKSKGKKDACYHKVRSRYDVWPSAYASGALVKCRKVGAKNWGNKSKKKNEGLDLDDNLLQIIEEEYRAVLDEKKRNARSVRSVGRQERWQRRKRQGIHVKKLVCWRWLGTNWWQV